MVRLARHHPVVSATCLNTRMRRTRRHPSCRMTSRLSFRAELAFEDSLVRRAMRTNVVAPERCASGLWRSHGGTAGRIP